MSFLFLVALQSKKKRVVKTGEHQNRLIFFKQLVCGDNFLYVVYVGYCQIVLGDCYGQLQWRCWK